MLLAGFLALLPAAAAPGVEAPCQGTVVNGPASGVTFRLPDGGTRTVHPRQVWTSGRQVTLAYCMPGDDARYDGRRLTFTPHGVGGGVVAARGGDVLLASGELVSPAPAALTTLDGVAQAGDWNHLRTGTTACARISLESGLVGELDVLRETPAAPADAEVKLDSVTVEGASTALRAWDEVRVALRGTPGAKAEVRMAGLDRFLPARETRPGVYEARLVCLPGVDLAESRCIGELTRGQTTVVRVGRQRLQLVATPPVVTAAWPADASVVHGTVDRVYACYTSAASYVDTPTVHLKVDGRDVTREATVTPDMVLWQGADALAAGRHQVRLRFKDAAGNLSERQWAFAAETP